MTIEPEKHEIIEDFSEVDAVIAEGKERDKKQFDADLEEQLAPVKAQADFDKARGEAEIARGVGDRRLRTGGGVMAGLLGVAAIVAAFGLWRKPEIVHDTKVVEQVKTVEVPKIITETKIVEVPRIIDHPVDRVVERVVEKEKPAKPAALPPPQPVNAPQALPPIDLQSQHSDAPNNPTPEVGMKMTEDQFRNTSFFRDAPKCNSRLKSHVSGEYSFEDGSKCWDSDANGYVDTSHSSTRYNGDLVACGPTGHVYASGRPEVACRVLHNGRIEDLQANNVGSGAGARAGRNNDPFADLFN